MPVIAPSNKSKQTREAETQAKQPDLAKSQAKMVNPVSLTLFFIIVAVVSVFSALKGVTITR